MSGRSTRSAQKPGASISRNCKRGCTPRPFSGADYRRLIPPLAALAQQTDRGMVLAEALVERLRQQHIILPALDVIERVCSEALTRGTRLVYEALTAPLADHHRRALDGLLAMREGANGTGLIWLRQPPGPPNPKHVLAHLERLKTLRDLRLPDALEHAIHQNRLLKLAREGGQMTAQHLRDLEPARRYATLVAVILDTRATLIDEIIDRHDRFMASLFSKAKRHTPTASRSPAKRSTTRCGYTRASAAP